jgi:hypothetical protein
LSVRGTRNQYSKDNENKSHGVPARRFLRPFEALFYLDSAKQSVETKRRRATDEVDEKKAAK